MSSTREAELQRSLHLALSEIEALKLELQAARCENDLLRSGAAGVISGPATTETQPKRPTLQGATPSQKEHTGVKQAAVELDEEAEEEETEGEEAVEREHQQDYEQDYEQKFEEEPDEEPDDAEETVEEPQESAPGAVAAAAAALVAEMDSSEGDTPRGKDSRSRSSSPDGHSENDDVCIASVEG